MIWLNDFLAALAVSHLAFLGIYFLIHYRGFLARMISLFCICVGAYVLATMSIFPANTLPSYLLFRLATLAPFALWIIAFHLFVDVGKISRSVWIAMAVFVIVRGIGSALALDDPTFASGGLAFVIVQLLPQIILFYFSAHAIYLAYKGYEADLVEHRRTLRVVFVAVMGVLITFIVGIGIVNGLTNTTLTPPTVLFSLYSLYLLLTTTAFGLFAFRLNDQALTLVPDHSVKPRSETQSSEPLDANPEIIQSIKQLMEQDRLYTQAGLTISDLAESLSIQEYRLRKLINQGLQYRNFNQFLNSYRTADASKKLMESDAPISSIALDVGYSSLSVFNKAFKDRYGMTPTEYRSNHATTPASAGGAVVPEEATYLHTPGTQTR